MPRTPFRRPESLEEQRVATFSELSLNKTAVHRLSLPILSYNLEQGARVVARMWCWIDERSALGHDGSRRPDHPDEAGIERAHRRWRTSLELLRCTGPRHTRVFS